MSLCGASLATKRWAMRSKEYRGLQIQPLQAIGVLSVRNYLKSRKWIHISDGTTAAIYHSPIDSNIGIRVPLAPRYTDYSERLADVIVTVAEIEDRHPFEVFTDIMLPPSDVMRFSLAESVTVAGTLPFDVGMQLLGGMRQTLLSAALAAERHQRYYPRMSGSDDVNDFLSKCLLGQTEVSSFTATFICPVQEHPERVIQDFFDPLLMNTPDPFPRIVTRNVMTAADTLVKAVRDDTIRELLAGDVAPISANLCDALMQMKPESADGTLTISTSWARTLPAPPLSVAARVELPAEYFPTIRDIGSALKPPATEIPPQFIGHVTELSRHDMEGPIEGPITVTLVVMHEERAVRAKVDLDAAEFPDALKAFKEGTYVSIEGELIMGARVSRFKSYRNFKPVG
jgi:hypothetical protein